MATSEAQRLAQNVADIHFLTEGQKECIAEYLVFFLKDTQNRDGFYNFYNKLCTDRRAALKFSEEFPVEIEVCENGYFPVPVAQTEADVKKVATLFATVLKTQSKSLSKNEVSFYLSNYTGYGFNCENLIGKSRSQKKLLRVAGLFRTLRSLPVDTFNALKVQLEKGELPPQLSPY